MSSLLPSDIFPLIVGKRWVYSAGRGIFNKNADITIRDKKNSLYLMKFSSGKHTGSFVIKSDVDMSIIAYSKYDTDTLDDEEAFEAIPRIELLKSPLISGASWENSLGTFSIISSSHKLKLGDKVYPDCLYIQLKDTSGTFNDIYIKSGVGILFASLYIDGIGKVNVNLKGFN